MPRCRGITQRGTRCLNSTRNNSNYCHLHPSTQRTERIWHKPLAWNVFFFVLTIISFAFSWYSIVSSNPVFLEIDQRYDVDAGRLYVSVTNTHFLKRTGAISLYKLEINPNKPEQIYEEGIGPGETKNYSLTFKVKHAKINKSPEMDKQNDQFTLPAEAYYVYAHTSISYKITCDNCPSNGFIRRIPPTQSMEFNIPLNPQKKPEILLPVYEWVDYKLEDIAMVND
ncbi:MAG: hypothetical protein AABX70_05360 [Nanoarchaeota archaeon]